MFSKRKTLASVLPGWAGIAIDTLGWPEIDAAEQRHAWDGGTDILSLHYFPGPPNVPRPVGDDDACFIHFERYADEAGAALIEARWIQVDDQLPATRSISKSARTPTHASYVGALTVPFAACSWVAKVESFDTGPTGQREAVWADQRLRHDPTLDIAALAAEIDPPGIHGAIRRHPSDDASFDHLLPEHPLSRARRLLAGLASSLTATPETRLLERFG